MSGIEEQLLNLVKDVGLKAALGILAGKGVLDLSVGGFEKLKKLMGDKWNEGKYAFVPYPEEAKRIDQNRDKPDYKEVSFLIPKYRELDLISAGLLIRDYQEEGNAKANERIAEIKTQILKRPNGKHLIKILNLPTTPFFSLILTHLETLKKQGYSTELLEGEFDEIVEEWEGTSMFVKKEHAPASVITFVNQQIGKKSRVFFLLGMKSAKIIVENALEELEVDGAFERDGYTPTRKITGVSGNQKIEVTITREQPRA